MAPGATPERSPRDGPRLTGAELDRRLAAAWAGPPGLIGWLSSVDHKDIGRRYVVTAFVFLALAGILAMRDAAAARKARATTSSAPERYNEIFTMHGTTMMFLFAVPVMEAMAI